MAVSLDDQVRDCCLKQLLEQDGAGAAEMGVISIRIPLSKTSISNYLRSHAGSRNCLTGGCDFITLRVDMAMSCREMIGGTTL